MRHYIVRFYPLNKKGLRIGGFPVFMRFDAPSYINTEGAAFKRMLLEYSRCVGCGGTAVEIIDVDYIKN